MAHAEIDLRTTSDADDRHLVEVRGEVDLNTAPRLREALTELTSADDPRAIHIDLADVLFMDSTGLNALVAAYRLALEARVELRVVKASEMVGHLLRTTRVSELVGDPGA